MRLGSLRPPAPADDLAAAIRSGSSAGGHRPALTVLGPDVREEQGYASLAQWAAKGAHLLTIEAMLEPGDTVALVGPARWMSVAVLYAAWWNGLAVAIDGTGAVTVVHESCASPTGEAYAFGDAVDGTPVNGGALEPWAIAVQAFPDQPPPPTASADARALIVDDRSWSQRELLEHATTWGPTGVLGVEEGADPLTWVSALAVRPLVTGAASLLLRAGVPRETATQERVAVWV